MLVSLTAGTGLAVAELPGMFDSTPPDGDDRRHSVTTEVNADPPISPENRITPDPGDTEPDESDDSPSDEDSTTGPDTVDMDGSATPTTAEMVRLVNEQRSAAGCGDVTVDDRLAAAAEGHSRDMADNGYFDHTSLDGRDFGRRAAEHGYDWAIGENIAAGQRTVQEVMDAWMNSDGHRANILNCDARAIGLGIADDGAGTRYWTQLFGSH